MWRVFCRKARPSPCCCIPWFMRIDVPTITKRERVRRLKSQSVVQTRYVVNATDAETGRRKQYFFERLRDAQAKRDALVTATRVVGAAGIPLQVPDDRGEARPGVNASVSTVAEAVRYWLDSLDDGLKACTRAYYVQMARYILRPTPIGTPVDRRRWSRTGLPQGVELLEPLGPLPLAGLTTADIRLWHKKLGQEVGQHTANAAKKVLGAALARAAEDLGQNVPLMPRKAGKGRSKERKRILTPDQVGKVIAAAMADPERGIYFAFPFLTGVRPSEQLGLLWKDVDLDQGVIHIRRMQEIDGRLSDITKTPAGNRRLPISPLLFELLSRHRARCPNGAAGDARVFSTLGTAGSRRHAVRGLPLTYANFRASYWRPMFESLGLPYVSPHSARHTFISTLQANGIEVGLVAKLAGHANATVTLAHYTHAVRGGEAAIVGLEQAYSAGARLSGSGK